MVASLARHLEDEVVPRAREGRMDIEEEEGGKEGREERGRRGFLKSVGGHFRKEKVSSGAQSMLYCTSYSVRTRREPVGSLGEGWKGSEKRKGQLEVERASQRRRPSSLAAAPETRFLLKVTWLKSWK